MDSWILKPVRVPTGRRMPKLIKLYLVLPRQNYLLKAV
jgi:hypothetical protein